MLNLKCLHLTLKSSSIHFRLVCLASCCEGNFSGQFPSIRTIMRWWCLSTEEKRNELLNRTRLCSATYNAALDAKFKVSHRRGSNWTIPFTNLKPLKYYCIESSGGIQGESNQNWSELLNFSNWPHWKGLFSFKLHKKPLFLLRTTKK